MSARCGCCRHLSSDHRTYRYTCTALGTWTPTDLDVDGECEPLRHAGCPVQASEYANVLRRALWRVFAGNCLEVDEQVELLAKAIDVAPSVLRDALEVAP